jgi:hypothetical protein
MKSKKLLFVALDKFFNTTEFGKLKLKHKSISNETYGRDSRIYVYGKDTAERRALERFLDVEGFKVCKDYWPGSAVTEVAVSYFRGSNWDE